jgi:hypothetical protein
MITFKRNPRNIASASRSALAQPRYAHAALADGARLRLRRLSWIEAVLLWEEFSAALLGLLDSDGSAALSGGACCERQAAVTRGIADQSGPQPASAATQSLSQARAATECRATGDGSAFLSSLPALALKLAAICAEQDEAELAAREACDVLAIAAAALRHNFIAPKGVADFFAALAELSG